MSENGWRPICEEPKCYSKRLHGVGECEPDEIIIGFDVGTDDAPLVGVVVKHAKPPELIVTMEPDDRHNWMMIGWIANDGLIQVQD